MVICDMWHVTCRRVRALQGDCVRGGGRQRWSKGGVNIVEHERTERGTHGKVSMFATDIDDHALAEACTAGYPPNIEPPISAERRQWLLAPITRRSLEALRIRHVGGARHDLGKDPPFSRAALVSCGVSSGRPFQNVQTQKPDGCPPNRPLTCSTCSTLRARRLAHEDNLPPMTLVMVEEKGDSPNAGSFPE